MVGMSGPPISEVFGTRKIDDFAQPAVTEEETPQLWEPRPTGISPVEMKPAAGKHPTSFRDWLLLIFHDPAIKAYRTFVSALGGIGTAGATVAASTDVSAGQAYGFGWKAIAATTAVDFLRNVGEELGKRLRNRPAQ